MIIAMRVLASFATATALAVSVPTAHAQSVPEKSPVDIKEWTVPYPDSRPRDPDVEGTESVWFVGQRDDYIANFNPVTESFLRVDLKPGMGPHNLIVDEEGTVWIAGNRIATIGRYVPETETMTEIDMPNDRARDPHTLIFDRTGRFIWFTVQGGNFIGRLTKADRSLELIEVPTPRARPYGIKQSPTTGHIWVALFGTNKLAEVDPTTLALTEHELPDEDARPRRLGITSEGDVYYTDYARGTLGHFDPEARLAEEWTLPSGEASRPYGMAVDDKDRIWLVETGTDPNTFVGFDSKKESFFSITHIPSGAGAIRHMDYHAPTGTIWFGTDANTIGRAKVKK